MEQPATTISSAQSVMTSSMVVRDASATISVNFADASIRDTHLVMIDWDDGTVSAGTVTETNGSGSVSASHSYARPGRYTVTMTLTEKDEASVVGTDTIQVRGGPPAR
jgi:PKD repeat protein